MKVKDVTFNGRAKNSIMNKEGVTKRNISFLLQLSKTFQTDS